MGLNRRLDSNLVPTLAAITANTIFAAVDGAAFPRTSYQVPASVFDARWLRTSQNLADLNNAGTARTNLGLGSAAVANVGDFATAAQGALAASALQPAAIGVSLQAYNGNLADIAALAPGAPEDGYALTWDNGAGAFVLASLASLLPVEETTPIVYQTGDVTRTATFDLSALTAARSYALPNVGTTLAGLGVAQTFTAAQIFTGGLKAYRNGIIDNFIAGGAGNATMTGASNVVIGSGAGISMTTGVQNVIIGQGAAPLLTTGSNSIIIGSLAGLTMTINSDAILIGRRAGGAITTSAAPVFVGANAGRFMQSGIGPVCIGNLAGEDNVSGDYIVAIGNEAGEDITGGYSTAVGGKAGERNSTGAFGTFLGAFAGQLSSGTGHVFIGYSAGQNEISNNRLYIANSNTATPLIYGEFDNAIARINGRFQVYGLADQIQGEIRANATQTNPLLNISDSSGNIYSKFNKVGYFMTRKTSAPADGDLATSEMALWLDDSTGAAQLMIKAKDNAGTVMTGSVALA